MKKIILFIVLICFAAGAAAAGYFYFQSKRKMAIDQVLPKGPILYVHVRDLSKKWQQFSQTPLGQKLAKLDLIGSVKKVYPNSDHIAVLENIAIQWTNPSNQLLMDKFFGKEFAIAFYPTNFNFQNMSMGSASAIQNVIGEVGSNIFIVTRVGPDVQLAEVMGGVLGKYGSNISTEKVDYNNQKITVLTINDLGLKIGYLQMQDLLIVGLGEHAAQECINVKEDLVSPLADDTDYSKVKDRFYGSSHLDVFSSLDGPIQIMQGVLLLIANQAKMEESVKIENAKALGINPAASNDLENQVYDFISQLKGFKFLGLSHEWDQVYKAKLNLFFNKDEMPPQTAAFYSCAPKDNTTISLIPKDVLAYQWSGCLDLKYYWDLVKQEIMNKEAVSGNSSMTEQIKGFETMLGFSIENDLIAGIGDEFSGYLADVKIEGAFPIPELVLFVKVTDKEKIDKILNKLTGMLPIKFISEDYSNYPIQYLNLAFGEDIQPAYAFINDYLMISINRGLLKRSIDALAIADGSLSLGANEQFKEVNFGLTDKNSGVWFVQLDKFVRKMRMALEWGDQWSQDQVEKKKAFISGSQKRLDDVTARIPALQGEQKVLTEKLDSLKSQLSALESQGGDVSTLRSQITQAEEEIGLKQKELADAQEQEASLWKIVQSYKASTAGLEQRQFYQDNVIDPILGILESIPAVGARSFMEDGLFESNFYIKF